MPTSNRIILTDVDGVLLEWERHFTTWMLERNYYDESGKKILENLIKKESNLKLSAQEIIK